MKFALPSILLLLPQSIAQTVDQYKECKRICNDYGNTKLKSNTCHPARYIHPKPSTHKACVKGEIMGFDHACLPTCTGKPHYGRDDEAGNSYSACKKFWNRRAPNNELAWCRTSYDRAYKRVQGYIKEVSHSRILKEVTGNDENGDSLAVDMNGEMKNVEVPEIIDKAPEVVQAPMEESKKIDDSKALNGGLETASEESLRFESNEGQDQSKKSPMVISEDAVQQERELEDNEFEIKLPESTEKEEKDTTEFNVEEEIMNADIIVTNPQEELPKVEDRKSEFDIEEKGSKESSDVAEMITIKSGTNFEEGTKYIAALTNSSRNQEFVAKVEDTQSEFKPKDDGESNDEGIEERSNDLGVSKMVDPSEESAAMIQGESKGMEEEQL